MVSIHDALVQDALVLVVASLLGYLFKFFLKPNKYEVKFIAQILSLIITILIKWAEDHVNTKENLDRARKEFVELKSKISNKSKIEIG